MGKRMFRHTLFLVTEKSTGKKFAIAAKSAGDYCFAFHVDPRLYIFDYAGMATLEGISPRQIDPIQFEFLLQRFEQTRKGG